MTYCKRCGVKLRDNSPVCVLCGSATEELDDRSQREYPAIKFSNRMRYMVRIIAILSVLAVCICLIIDRSTDSDTIWTLMVLAATIYGWTAFLTRKNYKNIGLMIFIQLISISVLAYAIDFSTGNHGWMLSYVLPFMIIAAQGILTAIIIVRPMYFRAFVLYQLQIGVMGILSILLVLFHLTQVTWPYVTAFIYSALILCCTLLLGDRRTKQELIKRFHF